MKTNRQNSVYICNGDCGHCRFSPGSDYCNRPGESRFAYELDRILTNRWLGFPILLAVLFAVFQAAFTLGAWPQAWIDSGVQAFGSWVASRLREGWATSLLTDGIIRGVGAVLSFLPNIFILFFFLSLLEDSGYMARAAFLMDKLMHAIGLHGNSFIPMLVGFGCNVPAIMAARDIRNRKDRVLTMLMIPFMSCSARLPVYLLFVGAFFPRYKALVMIALYAAGIVLSILFAFVMKHTRWFRKEMDDDVFMLPAFRLPPWKPLWKNIWLRCEDYLHKITTVIVAASVAIWALEYFPVKDGQPAAPDASYLAEIGHWMEPVMEPLGFDWRMNVCILTGLPAKEAIVSTLGILYPPQGEEETLAQTLQHAGGLSPAVALAFMLFVLLYFPCFATVASLRREIGWKWALFTVVHSLLLAWVVAFVAFRLGTVLL